MQKVDKDGLQQEVITALEDIDESFKQNFIKIERKEKVSQKEAIKMDLIKAKEEIEEVIVPANLTEMFFCD